MRIILTILVFTLISCGGKKEKANLTKESDMIGEMFLSKVKENTSVLGATITDEGFLYIAVLDDGVDKSAMATYHCRLAKDELVIINAVKVVDATTYKKGPGWAKGKSLGTSYCD